MSSKLLTLTNFSLRFMTKFLELIWPRLTGNSHQSLYHYTTRSHLSMLCKLLALANCIVFILCKKFASDFGEIWTTSTGNSHQSLYHYTTRSCLSMSCKLLTLTKFFLYFNPKFLQLSSWGRFEPNLLIIHSKVPLNHLFMLNQG